MTREINDSVLAELRQICDANEEQLLKPEAVVQAAANPESVLHRYFTWDDSQAAAKWRLEEARQLIRSVELQYDESWLRGPVPAFVSLIGDRGKDGGGYRQTPQVLTNSQLRAELTATAKRELEGWARRHKMLRGLCISVLTAAGLPVDGIFSESEIKLAIQEQRPEEAA